MNYPKIQGHYLKLTKIYSYQTEIEGGKFFYFGIEKGIRQSLMKENISIKSESFLQLQVNVDGIPIFKSSNTQLWPILMLVKHEEKLLQSPFVHSCPFCW